MAKIFNDLYPERVAEGERTGEWVQGRPSFQNIRLELDQPSCTLTGGAKQLHPKINRLISVEESGALCGYPRNFKFLGSVGKQYQQVAQAVMPPVGEYLARMVKKGILAGKPPSEKAFRRVEIFTDHVERESLIANDAKYWAANAAPVVARESTGAKATRAKNRTRLERGEPPVKQRELPLPEPKRVKNAKPPSPPAGGAKPRVGSGARIRELLKKKWPVEKILETIHKEFPTSRATKSDVAWNKRKIFIDEGVRV